MKSYSLSLVLLFGLLCVQCSNKADVAPKVDYDQGSRDLMQAIAPQLVGTWTMRQVQVTYQRGNYYQAQIPLTADTLFRDFGTLTLTPAATPRLSPEQAQYPEFEGTLSFRNKSYPIYLQLRANPERVGQQQGPQAFFMFDTNFPVGSRMMDPEERFLRNLGLLYDNYSLAFTEGPPTMVWQGLNRGVDRVELRK